MFAASRQAIYFPQGDDGLIVLYKRKFSQGEHQSHRWGKHDPVITGKQ